MIGRLSFSLALLTLALTIAGCDTTRDKSTRAQIATERVKIADKKTAVRRPYTKVKVERVELVRGGQRAAVAVQLRSSSSWALSDLPIVVGVRRAGHAKLLNGQAGRPYFDSHIAALAPHRAVWWVLELPRTPRGRVFVRVGAPAREQRNDAVVPPVAVSNVRLVKIAAKTSSRSKRGRRTRTTSWNVAGEVKNDTGFPQYAIPLYAVVRRGGRVVAAGSGAGVKFSTGESQPFKITLIGRTGTDPVVSAMPAVLTPYR